MKRWTALEINGETFEFDTKDICDYNPSHPWTSLYDCYERPSRTKENIYEAWRRWFHELDGELWVSSYNCNFFTISGYFKYNGDTYRAYITASHNKCCLAV